MPRIIYKFHTHKHWIEHMAAEMWKAKDQKAKNCFILTNYPPGEEWRHNISGIMGELVFELATGTPMSRDITPGSGDQGFDFVWCGFEVDVKAARNMDRPLLVEFADKPEWKRAERYVLVAVDEDEHLGYIAGWCTAEKLFNTKPREFSNQPGKLKHFLKVEDLEPWETYETTP